MEKNLIQKYKNSAELHGAGTLKGDYRVTNKAHGILLEIYHELKNTGQLALLKSLLRDENSSVQIWAARHLLIESEHEAIKTLEEISKENSLIGLSAQTIIEEWKSERLET